MNVRIEVVFVVFVVVVVVVVVAVVVVVHADCHYFLLPVLLIRLELRLHGGVRAQEAHHLERSA
jgi:hypothetical protein